MAISIIRVEDPSSLQDAFEVRRQVFIEEQHVPEDMELDEYDDAPQTIHILARDENGSPVGTARFRPYHDAGVAKVERVAVVGSHRGTGLGRSLMKFIEAEASHEGFRELRLNAQTHAQCFYERLGYKAVGNVFFEAGIEHIAMWKPLSTH
ncbi:GNAT family N-acetyltransferase [Alicyclobacillus pomorum]|uniref:GNAT family N-acetyltransferase n=1 Tax=Alicyclobacillus pomorum TaxID=204470 RepID=UPI0004026460